MTMGGLGSSVSVDESGSGLTSIDSDIGRTISDHGSSVEHRGTEVVRHYSAMVKCGCNTTSAVSLSPR